MKDVTRRTRAPRSTIVRDAAFGGTLAGGHAPDRQRGLTLIEIMVTLILLSVLVLGLGGLWAGVSGQFLSLTLRQKAIFVLSGEMERLSALYRFTAFAADAVSSDGYAAPNTTRLIYPDPDAGAPGVAVVGEIVTQTAATFDCGDSTCAGNVFHDQNGVGGNDDRVYVWIDQARKITGRLSWFLNPTNVSANCSDGGTPGTVLGSPGGTAACRELTAYLEYPFRFVDGTTPDAAADIGAVGELTLVTIVGRR